MADPTQQTRVTPCPSIFGPGELRTVLDVVPHPKLTCVNIITGEFFFRQAGQPDQQKMGNIKAFVINRTMPGLRGRGIKLRNRWIQTLLDYKLIDPKNPEYSVSGALSTLYNAAGARRPIFKSIDKKLKTRRIVYIDSFQIDMAYRRGGTGTVAFDDFHKVLRQFTGVYSVRGALKLLQPDVLDPAELTATQSRGQYQWRL
ncbi:hypothetical protein B0A55_05167, partial [Friedmanniomyces simplex]